MPSTPSDQEQLLLELVNRFRANPGQEASLLTGPGARADIVEAINYFGVSVSALSAQLAQLSAAAPLAWNGNLADAADSHNAAMIAADSQQHQLPGEPDPGARATNAGYNYSMLGENIYLYAQDALNAHAAFVIDWGYDAGDDPNGDFRSNGDGMQDPPGHRVNLINAAYTEVGISMVAENNPNTQAGPVSVTQDLGTRPNYQAQFVGVVINDTDHDHFYDVGEGLGGVTVTLQRAGSTYTTTSWSSGGWQIAVPAGTYTITFSGGGLATPVVKTATLAGTNVEVDAEANNARRPDHDFNGDGRSDILWRGDAGDLSDWLGTAKGGFVGNDANAFTRVSTNWHVVDTGDFNGDGRSDILWRSDTGQLSDWLGQANGGFVGNDANAFANVSTTWHVVGTGDFNGDGRSDILWRSDSGQLSDWLGKSNGGFTGNDGNALVTVPTAWHVVGTGDFNGDGRSDILWRSDSGQLSDWLGNASGGFSGNDANALVTVSTNWHVVGTGDFNGDGRSDILWRSDSGQLSDWLGTANGGFMGNDANALVAVPTDWRVEGTGDFNGDGRSDILWRNSNGQFSDWLGQANGGFVVNDANAAGSVPSSWHMQEHNFLI